MICNKKDAASGFRAGSTGRIVVAVSTWASKYAFECVASLVRIVLLLIQS